MVGADIKGFFDHVDHEWMIRMLQERVNDRALLWLIKKRLKAGVLVNWQSYRVGRRASFLGLVA